MPDNVQLCSGIALGLALASAPFMKRTLNGWRRRRRLADGLEMKLLKNVLK